MTNNNGGDVNTSKNKDVYGPGGEAVAVTASGMWRAGASR